MTYIIPQPSSHVLAGTRAPWLSKAEGPSRIQQKAKNGTRVTYGSLTHVPRLRMHLLDGCHMYISRPPAVHALCSPGFACHRQRTFPEDLFIAWKTRPSLHILVRAFHKRFRGGRAQMRCLAPPGHVSHSTNVIPQTFPGGGARVWRFVCRARMRSIAPPGRVWRFVCRARMRSIAPPGRVPHSTNVIPQTSFHKRFRGAGPGFDASNHGDRIPRMHTRNEHHV